MPFLFLLLRNAQGARLLQELAGRPAVEEACWAARLPIGLLRAAQGAASEVVRRGMRNCLQMRACCAILRPFF